MERNANYTLVGGVALALLVGLGVFIVWLAQLSFARNYDLYDIVFVGPVRGLSEGGEVHFNGIKVGEITDIALDKRDPNRVIARARVEGDVPVRVDSYATLEPQGITGLNYVQITAGTTGRRLLKSLYPENQVPILRSQRSAISDLLEGGGTVLSRTVEALDRVNRLLSERNIQLLNGTLENVNTLSAEAAQQKQLIANTDRLIRDLTATSTEAQRLLADSRQMLNGDGRRTLADVQATAAELRATAVDVRGTVAGLAGPTRDFATTGLPQLSSAILTLQQAAESLDRLVAEVEQSPQSLLTKAPPKELEVQP